MTGTYYTNVVFWQIQVLNAVEVVTETVKDCYHLSSIHAVINELNPKDDILISFNSFCNSCYRWIRLHKLVWKINDRVLLFFY